MIGRHWRGLARREAADHYVEHLRRETLPALGAIEGFGGAYVLRRESGDEVEFVVLTLWDSLDSVRAFAGDDLERAVVPPAAQALLSSYDDTVLHYDVVIDDR
jgi:heme-degrading monooxygenase HmoA